MLAQRLENGQTVIWNGQRFRNTRQFLEAFYCEPMKEMLERLYCRQQFSMDEIARKFVSDTGLPVSGKLIYKFLVSLGVPVRNKSEACIMKWKLGKVDTSLPKIRRKSVERLTFGSDTEKDIRYRLLCVLNEQSLNADIIIGDQTHSVLPRYEIDIPIVLIDKVTQRICKIAVDVDSEFFHGHHEDMDTDSQKTYLLENSGWRVIRIYLDGKYEEIIDAKIQEAVERIVGYYRRGVNPLCLARV